uniref:hypothetical protein n=1 Tax=Pseudomonas sp. TaxID=306 RepID=UPI0010BACB02|nr:hypothetical protein [Pseudomonas sp.]QBM91811.1 hypothetical protein pA54BH1_p02 [Pseudomonas sp.]
MFKTILKKILIRLLVKLAMVWLFAALTMAPVEPVLDMQPQLIWVQVVHDNPGWLSNLGFGC